MKKILGIFDKVFWIAEYDGYGLTTLNKIPAYTDSGELSYDVVTLVLDHELKIEDLHLGSPVEAVADIIMNERIDKFLTPEKQEELIKLFKK